MAIPNRPPQYALHGTELRPVDPSVRLPEHLQNLCAKLAYFANTRPIAVVWYDPTGAAQHTSEGGTDDKQ